MTKSFKFPRTARLLTPAAYKRVFNHSKKLNYREFTVYISRNELDNPRLGLAVSKKAAKKAVTRNQIKRIIRESFRLRQYELKGWDIVIVARYAAGQLSQQQLSALIQNVWKRLGSC